ncbi:hypothetical protein GMRT_12308 [Giardia muris]|uniref:Uncharacterized protein n=1 Tax=Giardia muris TaxID=5742 RepID=A0A4Z1T0M8_GIAMU|nr:hypothetical protein GMRT_12308 [Giardia muris]|eukprot:TNJ30535.1 hypothetical protein GMRT_12308 [Giardia muris]
MSRSGEAIAGLVQELWTIHRRKDEIAQRRSLLQAAITLRQRKLLSLRSCFKCSPRFPASRLTLGDANLLESATSAQIYEGQPLIHYLQDREGYGTALQRLDRAVRERSQAMRDFDGDIQVIGFEPPFSTNIAGMGGIFGPSAGIPSRILVSEGYQAHSDEFQKSFRQAIDGGYFPRQGVSHDEERDDTTFYSAAQNSDLYKRPPLLAPYSMHLVTPKSGAKTKQVGFLGLNRVLEEAWDVRAAEMLQSNLNRDDTKDDRKERRLFSLSEGLRLTKIPPVQDLVEDRLEYLRTQRAKLRVFYRNLSTANQARMEQSTFAEALKSVKKMMMAAGLASHEDLCERARIDALRRHARIVEAMKAHIDAGEIFCVRLHIPERPHFRPHNRILELLYKYSMYTLPTFDPRSLRFINRHRRRGLDWERLEQHPHDNEIRSNT